MFIDYFIWTLSKYVSTITGTDSKFFNGKKYLSWRHQSSQSKTVEAAKITRSWLPNGVDDMLTELDGKKQLIALTWLVDQKESTSYCKSAITDETVTPESSI
jgi:hypothetical protein